MKMGDDLFEELYSPHILRRIRKIADMKPTDITGTMLLSVNTTLTKRTTKIHVGTSEDLSYLEFSLGKESSKQE